MGKTTSNPTIATLERLLQLQESGQYNELNEAILSLESEGGDKETQNFFELHLADVGFAQWHRENSCGYDEIEE